MKIKTLLGMMILCFATASQAATFYVKPGGAGSKDCLTPETACETLQTAYNLTAVGDEIWLAEGTYTVPAGHLNMSRAVAWRGGFDAEFAGQSDNPNLTVITSNGVADQYRLFAITTGQSQWVTFDTLTLTGVTNGDSHGGLLHSYSAGAWIRLDNVIVSGNIINGGIIEMNIAGDRLEVIDSYIGDNRSSGNRGVIYLNGASADLTQAVIANNNGNGGCAGVVLNASASLSMKYSTLYQNNNSGACSGGLKSSNTTAGSIRLMANLVLANGDASAAGNIEVPNAAVVVDQGYNLIGSAGVSYTSPALDLASTSSIPVKSEYEIVTGFGDNGGNKPSVKITKTSPVRNAIPYDGIPFYGVGKSATYPFVSLQQARSALAREDYEASTYYFDLRGSYDAITAEFMSGVPADLVFTTWVDEEGYVLIASSNSSDPTAAAYTETTDLQRRSDYILQSNILSDAAFVFNEVRISSYSDGARGTFDGYNKSTEAVNKIKAFETLPNAGEPGGSAWVVTHSSSGNNYFLGNARGAGTGEGQISRALNLEIYHSSDVDDGIHWIPSKPNEALKRPNGSPGDFSDDLDLWVRSEAGVCDGAGMPTDARGLPRSDRVQGHEPPANCDIGAFEFNDYFQTDCEEEDGMRPENNIKNVDVSWCFNPLNQKVTPKELMENIGSTSWQWIMLLLGIGIIRRYAVR